MFKKFLLTFILCMGVFGVTAFADVKDDYLYFVESSPGYYIYFNTFTVSDTRITFPDSYFTAMETVKDWSIQFEFLSAVSTNCIELLDYLPDLEYVGGAVIPPEIAPTVQEAILKIVPDLSAQLKILLPVGVLILSIVLGVSLVRRLVPLFL